MADRIYRGRGTDIPYELYMTLINEVFGFDGVTRDFRTLLPKLYRPGRTPQAENYVVVEDGRCVSAIGAFSHEIRVCGTAIPCRGIGNVAVSKIARNRGYMKDCMHMALTDMVKDGIALSTLGGRRQRYRYFGYEKVGPCYTFAVNADNLRHTFGADFQPELDIRQVEAEDIPLLDCIRKVSSSGYFSPVRRQEDFFDILSTWQASVWAALRDGNLIGYALREPSGLISELRVTDPDDLLPLLDALRKHLDVDTLTLRLPEHEDACLRTIETVAEGCQIGCSMSYNVLNYQLVCDAFLRLRATYAPLTDGKITLLIHGFAGEECLCFSVKNGIPSICPSTTNVAPELELTHEEAMRLLFAPFCLNRRFLPAAVQTWFPLPIWMYRADEV